MSKSPICQCGATMVQCHDDMRQFAIPNGRYFCFPCSEIRREMLSALKAVIVHGGSTPGEWLPQIYYDQVKAAIKKAEGAE